MSYRTPCSVSPCIMFSIIVHHVQYHRASCSVSPCTMFSIAVHHVQYRRASCSVSPCIMFSIAAHHVQYHRASCSVSPCIMFRIAVHHVQYRRASCSVSPCTMFSIAVHHVQYRRASCSVSPCTMLTITLHLPTLVHYTVYTKSHISYCSNACRCCTKCTAHQFFAIRAVTLPGSTGVGQVRALWETGMSVRICPQQMWTSEVTRYFRVHTNIATDKHGSTKCGCRNWKHKTRGPDTND